MAVCLTGLTGIKAFDTVGEPATLAQRWKTWKSEFELYVVASGVSDNTQKRALLLHLAGPQVRDIFNNSILADVKGEAKDYTKAMDALTNYFKPHKNVPMARQVFLAAKPTAGETINNFVAKLQNLAEHCEYNEERNNQVRDRAISFIKDKTLKAKLYREGDLTLAKLLDVVSQYHDKDALILVPDTVQHLTRKKPPQASKSKGKCWRCDRTGHYAKDCRNSREHKCEKCGENRPFWNLLQVQPRTSSKEKRQSWSRRSTRAWPWPTRRTTAKCPPCDRSRRRKLLCLQHWQWPGLTPTANCR